MKYKDLKVGDDEKSLTIDMTIYEMATVGRSINDNFIILVNPDSSRNDAYFKIANHQEYTSARKSARISFFKPETFYHKDGKQQWKMNSSEIKMMIKFLESAPKMKMDIDGRTFKTIWEQCIWHWNNECGFTDDSDFDITLPMGTLKDSALFKNPQFVPLNQKMPDYTKLQL